MVLLCSWVCCGCVKGGSLWFCVKPGGSVNGWACDWFGGADELCQWKLGMGA